MPTIAEFFGITIMMYPNDHGQPHLHARYAEYEVAIALRTQAVIKGHAPSRVVGLVREWISLHEAELNENWELCQRMLRPNRVAPLE